LIAIENLESYRLLSEVFDLNFPEDNVYGVKPGLTRSVCDGYWLFVKLLDIGNHSIKFKGETLLVDDPVKEQLTGDQAYKKIWRHINKKSSFRLDISYELEITNI